MPESCAQRTAGRRRRVWPRPILGWLLPGVEISVCYSAQWGLCPVTCSRAWAGSWVQQVDWRARQLGQRLPGSRLVTLHDDYVHGVFASRGDACVDSTVAAYLVDGTVPARMCTASALACRHPKSPTNESPARGNYVSRQCWH
ncbi:alpha/beta hydrolase [Streptomyces sp. NPDC048156]|uniref:alpha/beta hydrolase n=1 Tax=Streptomyces sp. NPDC048156 TaxID=3365502 RepID=UPI0037119719